MSNKLSIRSENIVSDPEFEKNSKILGDQVAKFLKLAYPAYLVGNDEIEKHLKEKEKSSLYLSCMKYFRISSCVADTVDQIFETVNAKVEKLLTALHSINVPIGYGLVSREGVTNLVLGVYSSSDNVESTQKITQGMLSGIEMESYNARFWEKGEGVEVSHGILSAIPSLFLQEQKQTFSLSSIMRSLNGQDYTVLFLAKPIQVQDINQDINELISIRDKAFAISKYNIAKSNSSTKTESTSESRSDTKSNQSGAIAGTAGAGIGGIVGAFGGPLGMAIGAAAGGFVGTVVGTLCGAGETRSESYSSSVSETINNGETISSDIQNGFAIELMNYADQAIERLKSGRNNGIWQTAITYSAASEKSRNIIKACLCGELSKSDSNKLPLKDFALPSSGNEMLRIPEFQGKEIQNPLCTYMSSAELGLLCTMPTESVPDFEFQIKKTYPLFRSSIKSDSIAIGNVVDGKRAIENMPFVLSPLDLNKHVFICGITGSGKTTTVKKILLEAKKPFLVIESAKKEYRNLAIIDNKYIYTLGKPELNCPQINPFYIMPGISPQMHIDYLKDLFNASFSFYGPMPYILEKCLHTIYQNKGWELTVGHHPMLANIQKRIDFFDIDKVKEKYEVISHKYLFPTMQELRDEIARYVEEELKYDGEVAGNIKTAIKVRLENLCIGAKGFIFNTHEYLDFHELLERNVVFELEGLADDSDKAFSVGLLMIFINEYRQISKEMSGSKKMGLKHLLVVEEAHRLLKNIETERSSETMGNPKGKAVEHFTNMIAEMRSYGQGIIISEQIPTKLAPDVIKNSSTKIIQRTVSSDDQQIIANTIGIYPEDALQLGMLESGYAFAHKEGMSQPTAIKIDAESDIFIRDDSLYDHEKIFSKINMVKIRNIFSDSKKDEEVKQKILALMNSLFIESSDIGIESCQDVFDYFSRHLKKNNILLVSDEGRSLISEYITEMILEEISWGIYCPKKLPDDDLESDLKDVFFSPTVDKITTIKKEFSKIYDEKVENFAKDNVVLLIEHFLQENTKGNTNITGTVNEYFIKISSDTRDEIVAMIKQRSRLK